MRSRLAPALPWPAGLPGTDCEITSPRDCSQKHRGRRCPGEQWCQNCGKETPGKTGGEAKHECLKTPPEAPLFGGFPVHGWEPASRGASGCPGKGLPPSPCPEGCSRRSSCPLPAAGPRPGETLTWGSWAFLLPGLAESQGSWVTRPPPCLGPVQKPPRRVPSALLRLGLSRVWPFVTSAQTGGRLARPQDE